MTSDSYGLTRLVLTNFRNYQQMRLHCDVRPVLLTGSNGVGKTNILEAISFLSPGRGIRRAKLSDVCLTDSDQDRPTSSVPLKGLPWALAVTLSTPHGAWDIGTGLDTLKAKEGKERRIVKVDGASLKSQTLLSDYLHVLWLTPQMDRLFQEGHSTRRRFLDRLVYGVDSAHATRVTRYEHYMRERNRLLKTHSRETQWLDTLEAKMAEEGVAIAAARLLFVDRLQQANAWTLGYFPQALLSLKGDMEQWLLHRSALEGEEKFRDALKSARKIDKDSATARFGPHRTDFSVIYQAKNRDASFCSTGEQKALLISIIFAASRLQRLQGTGVPLMLLDEVVAHLDEQRRQALFEEILALKMQAWMTGTDTDLFKSFENKVQHFQIENATLHSIKF